MNDIKYVMLPRIEDKTKEVKAHPWLITLVIKV